MVLAKVLSTDDQAPWSPYVMQLSVFYLFATRLEVMQLGVYVKTANHAPVKPAALWTIEEMQ